MKTKYKNLTTARKGYIGQGIVEHYLLKNKVKLYAPVVDDFGIDYLIYYNNIYTTVQVKYHTAMREANSSSITVRIASTDADWIATPCHVNEETHIIWYRNDRKNETYQVSFALYTPKNNQVEKVNFYKSFLKSPIEENSIQ